MDHFCPKCDTLLRIGATTETEREGKVYLVQDLYCRNSNCPNNGKKIETVEVQK